MGNLGVGLLLRLSRSGLLRRLLLRLGRLGRRLLLGSGGLLGGNLLRLGRLLGGNLGVGLLLRLSRSVLLGLSLCSGLGSKDEGWGEGWGEGWALVSV